MTPAHVFKLRFLPSDPFHRDTDAPVGAFATEAEAEEVRRACPNAIHMEVVERPGARGGAAWHSSEH